MIASNIHCNDTTPGSPIVYGITDPLTFVLGTIFIVVLPGPNSVFVLAAGSMKGVPAGYWAAFGVFVGDAILMVLAATGAASLLYANPTLFQLLKYAGAAYLTWIGIGLMRQAWRGWFSPVAFAQSAQPVSVQTADSGTTTQASTVSATEAHASGLGDTRPHHFKLDNTKRISYAAPFRGALLISLLNPKAIFFFISFFVQFVDPAYEYPALTFLLLGLIVEVISVAYLVLLVHGGARLANRMRHHPRLSALAAAAVGSIFIGFGVKLAQATLS